MPLIPALRRQRQGISVSLRLANPGYRANSRTVSATHRKLVLEKTKNTKKQKQKKNNKKGGGANYISSEDHHRGSSGARGL